MAPVVQVVLTAFIHDTHEIILGGLQIRNDPVDLAWNERRLVIGVVDTQSKWFRRLFHVSSKYLLIFRSRLPIPWASYQCNSTSRRAPFGKRTVAIPLTFRHRPRPYALSKYERTRTLVPLAITSMPRIGPTTSNFMAPSKTGKHHPAQASNVEPTDAPSTGFSSRSRVSATGESRNSMSNVSVS